MKVKKQVSLIKGGMVSDDRGRVGFVNDFDFNEIQRFYVVENANTNIIRGFHGHFDEAKYVFAATGSVVVKAVYLSSKKKPSKKEPVYSFVLSANEPAVLYIPPQHANGFRALEPNSKVIFYSNLSLEESLKDDYRFSLDYWGKEVWRT